MSTTEILRELPELSRVEQRAILNRLIELDEDAAILDDRQRQADEAFQMLDAREAEECRSEASRGFVSYKVAILAPRDEPFAVGVRSQKAHHAERGWLL